MLLSNYTNSRAYATVLHPYVICNVCSISCLSLRHIAIEYLWNQDRGLVPKDYQ